MSLSAQASPLPEAGPRRRRRAAGDEQQRSFLRMVSHELRTPLNSILGFSEILTSELYGPMGAPQYKEYAAIIRGSGQKLLKLVNQVLEIARLEGRAVDFDADPEPLEPLLDDVLAGLREDIAQRDVAVLVTGRGELPTLCADPRGVRTVLANIIHNAVVFSPDGGQVRVRAERVDRFVDILVTDEGDGVRAEDIPRLLMPFEQGENALVRRGEGAGLGLPIANLTCQAMGGRLILDSAVGQGMTATIRLPAA